MMDVVQLCNFILSHLSVCVIQVLLYHHISFFASISEMCCGDEPAFCDDTFLSFLFVAKLETVNEGKGRISG